MAGKALQSVTNCPLERSIVRTLFINPTTGLAGDMLVAALLHAGADCPEFWSEIAKLPLEAHGCELRKLEVIKKGITARRFEVTIRGDDKDDQHVHHHHHEHDHHHNHNHHHDHHHHDHDHHGRSLADVLAIIEGSGVAESAKARAAAAFRYLAEAEATVHGMTTETIHFHEVGAFDAIVDVTAACVALDVLQIDAVVCAPVALGSGTVHCAHGDMPVPVPAVVELLRGAPTVFGSEKGELTTPTGAALLRAFEARFVSAAEGTIVAAGYGAGKRDLASCANAVQVLLLENKAAESATRVAVIEATLDDMPGEHLSHILPNLRQAGALDVCVLPCTMKKNRQGMLLQVLARSADREALCEAVLRQTTSFGVRWYLADRMVLSRQLMQIQTAFGEITVKFGRIDGDEQFLRIAPEYESCVDAARQAGVAFADVYDAAVAAARMSKL
jgi:uncharacterized protein (TIGR00299 family) protein